MIRAGKGLGELFVAILIALLVGMTVVTCMTVIFEHSADGCDYLKSEGSN